MKNILKLIAISAISLGIASAAEMEVDCWNGAINISSSSTCSILAGQNGANVNVSTEILDNPKEGISAVASVGSVTDGPGGKTTIKFAFIAKVKRNYTLGGALAASNGGTYVTRVTVADQTLIFTNENGLQPLGTVLVAEPGQAISVETVVTTPENSTGTASSYIYLLEWIS